MLRAWHPNHCSSHWFLCIQIFRVETSHHFKLVSSYSVICCYMNERSNLKKKIRIFLQKVLTQWAHKLHVLCLLIVSFSSLKKPEQIALLILLKFIYFLIEGWLLYRISLFSVNYQHESAIGIHMSPPSWTSLPSPSPSHPSMLTQSHCLSSLRHTTNSYWLSIYFTYGNIRFRVTLSIHLTFSFPLPER